MNQEMYIDESAGELLEVDKNLSFFGIQNRSEMNLRPSDDFAVIVLKKPVEECEYFDYATGSEAEVLRLGATRQLAFAPNPHPDRHADVFSVACGGIKDKATVLAKDSPHRESENIFV